MDDKILFNILLALSGVAFGTFFREFFNIFTSASTMDRIKKYKSDIKFYRKLYSSEKEKNLQLNEEMKTLENESTSLKSEIADKDETLWKLLQSKLMFSFETKDKAENNMKCIIKAFNYLLENKIVVVNAYETLKLENTGISTHEWEMIIKSGIFFKNVKSDFELTDEGATIFNYYKKQKRIKNPFNIN